MNMPGGQVGQGGVLQVGVDLLDDRVPAVGLVRGDGVEHVGVGGGEERVEPPQVEQRVLPGGLALGLRSGIRRTTSRPGTLLGLRLCRERGERDLGDLGPGDPARRCPRRRSRRCTRSWSTRRRRSRRSWPSSAGVHPDRDRDRGAAGRRGADGRAAVERRVRPHQHRPAGPGTAAVA